MSTGSMANAPSGIRFTHLAAASIGLLSLLAIGGVVGAFRAHVRALAPPGETASASVAPPKVTALPPVSSPVTAPSAPPPDPCRVLFEEKKLDEAERTCTKAVESETDPESRASIYTTLGLIEEKRQKKKSAETQFLVSLANAYSSEAGEGLARVSAWEAKARPGTTTIVSKGKSANVRKEPRGGAGKVVAVGHGSEVKTITTITNKDSSWCSVEVDGKKRGWISESLLAKDTTD